MADICPVSGSNESGTSVWSLRNRTPSHADSCCSAGLGGQVATTSEQRSDVRTMDSDVLRVRAMEELFCRSGASP